jgi:hypothetical protein
MMRDLIIHGELWAAPPLEDFHKRLGLCIHFSYIVHHVLPNRQRPRRPEASSHTERLLS